MPLETPGFIREDVNTLADSSPGRYAEGARMERSCNRRGAGERRWGGEKAGRQSAGTEKDNLLIVEGSARLTIAQEETSPWEQGLSERSFRVPGAAGRILFGFGLSNRARLLVLLSPFLLAPPPGNARRALLLR